MTSFNSSSPGTGTPVPGAGLPQPSHGSVPPAPAPPADVPPAAVPPAVVLAVVAAPAALLPLPSAVSPTFPPAPAPAAPPPFEVFRTRGPWVAGGLYYVVPSGKLVPIVEADDADSDATWYCITRGTYVGVTLNNALALAAVVGVSASAMKGHKTQSKAVAAFNEMLGYKMVAVVQ
ncbi:hypothetical protein C8R46DRAFT_1031646 [Mycena filopes]|nr:hypothetical protein C8R46DRAFT_1031646 [Mycena filopes]